jgi:hypothetical protein
MSYDPVPHSHIVPAGYLRAWASGRHVSMRLSGERRSRPISVRDAGVRTNFYRRTRPATGETIYDIEWSMQQAEDAALPVVADIAARWPLTLEDKSKVGQLFALQYLRGPAFRTWFDDKNAEQVAELRAAPDRYASPPPGMSNAEAIETVARHLLSDTYRVTKMLKYTRSVGIVFTSMNWTLIEFPASGHLATSDHPVVVWPLSRGQARPQPNEPNNGVIDTLETFIPLSPTRLLLLTWRDEVDHPTVVPARGRQMATANAFVVANADKQWFHELGVEPRLASGSRTPISPELMPGYDAAKANASTRRQKARVLANAEAKAPLSNDLVSVVSATTGLS